MCLLGFDAFRPGKELSINEGAVGKLTLLSKALELKVTSLYVVE
jgi:hypothetical protein